MCKKVKEMCWMNSERHLIPALVGVLKYFCRSQPKLCYSQHGGSVYRFCVLDQCYFSQGNCAYPHKAQHLIQPKTPFIPLSSDSVVWHEAGLEKVLHLSETQSSRICAVFCPVVAWDVLAISSPPPQEVLNMLKESKADIFVDPVLHTACALDIKHHCAAIPPGRGRRKCSCFPCATSESWGP